MIILFFYSRKNDETITNYKNVLEVCIEYISEKLKTNENLL